MIVEIDQKHLMKKNLYEFCKNDKTLDLQGSHWAPHVIHKDLWSKVGGLV